MALSQTERTKRYQEKRDAIMLRPSKEEGQQIREAAKAAGKSVSAYILDAVRAEMEKE